MRFAVRVSADGKTSTSFVAGTAAECVAKLLEQMSPDELRALELGGIRKAKRAVAARMAEADPVGAGDDTFSLVEPYSLDDRFDLVEPILQPGEAALAIETDEDGDEVLDPTPTVPVEMQRLEDDGGKPE